jgi:hypothetical protein
MTDFEKLGAFYLGREYDLAAGRLLPNLLLYDSKDLTTHAVCVGMTGSGKTGLCLSLLEEAAIDGVPAIAIDPKGDLGNLLLAFPDLLPSDFRPWIDESAAARNNQTPDEFAAATAQLWQKGLADWGQDGERIRRFRDAAEVAIYTPGSAAGLPLTVLRSFAAPSQSVQGDGDAFRERVSAAACGVLALLGMNVDPIQSREHILLSNILSHAWQQGQNLDVARLIQLVQAPPMERIGVMDLETIYPADERLELAMSLNNLLASPSFAGWMEGEPLDIKRLLHTPEGKPRIAILSIAHLSDAERMFFVTILLNEVIGWMRSQPGTTSLRALLYMDEVFGYFPPTANPPSKVPMLTLMKQARAFGLGCVLATQNPVDLDYKGLSNAGTWFLGRLQTERDKRRVLEGLEGASAAAGATFDRQQMEATLAGLSSRVFLMNNVHEDKPMVFQTRWALSYLRGPLTRGQIQTLMDPRRVSLDAASIDAPSEAAQGAARTTGSDRMADLSPENKSAAAAEPSTAAASAQPPVAAVRPSVPPEVRELFVRRHVDLHSGERLLYRPGLVGTARVHYVRATYKVDVWKTRYAVETFLEPELPASLWDRSLVFPQPIELAEPPEANAQFAPLPPELLQVDRYKDFERQLIVHLYRCQRVIVWHCKELKLYSESDEPLEDFRVRAGHLQREHRDRAVEKLRKKHADSLASIQSQIQKAEERLAREESQYRQRKVDTTVSIGQTILGALFGRKLASSTNVGRASTSARAAGRAAREYGDVERAQEALEEAKDKLAAQEKAFQKELEDLHKAHSVDRLELEELKVKPRKSDIVVEELAFAWLPWRIDDRGTAHVAW